MKVLFILENGIGYGHFQRAIIIAHELVKRSCEVTFLTQAGSTKIFEIHDFNVINLPFIHRLNNNIEELIILNLINEIIKEISPDVIIQDTYPESKILSLPSTFLKKKVLILRRIDSVSLNEFRLTGILSLYDKILCLQDKVEFENESQIPELTSCFYLNQSIKFIGPVFRKVSDPIQKSVLKKYFSKDSIKLIVTIGAGGEHFQEGFFEDLIESVNIFAQNYANKCTQEISILIIKGVYGNLNNIEKKLHNSVNIVNYEPNLHVLLRLSDICILRPGYNTTYEALSGRAKIIFVPGYSYMETQREWVEMLQKRFQGIEICFDVKKDLENAIFYLLKSDIPIRDSLYSKEKQFANEIIALKKSSPFSLGLKVLIIAQNLPQSISMYCKNNDIPIYSFENKGSDLFDYLISHRANSHESTSQYAVCNKDFIEKNDINRLISNGIRGVILVNNPTNNYKIKKYWSEWFAAEKRGVFISDTHQINAIEIQEASIFNHLSKLANNKTYLPIFMKFDSTKDYLPEFIWFIGNLNKYKAVPSTVEEYFSLLTRKYFYPEVWTPSFTTLNIINK